MSVYTIFERGTGRITGTVSTPQVPNVALNEGYIEGDFDPDRFLIIDDAVVEPPVWTPRVTRNQVTGIPRGSRIEVLGSRYLELVVHDGTLEFDLVSDQWVQLVIWPPGLVPKEVRVTG